MYFCSLTLRLAWPWPTPSSHQQHTLANNNIYPTCMAPLVARTMQRPVSTMAQISVFDVATAGTVPPECSLVALQAAGGCGPGRGRGRLQQRTEVKSAAPRPISSLQSLSARGRAVADQTSPPIHGQCPPRFPHQDVEPASPGFCERARWPRVGMKKPQTANLSGLPSSRSLQVAQQSL